MKNWNHLPSGPIELTIESEAYLELAKDYLSECQYEDAKQALEVAVRSINPQAEYLFGILYQNALGVDRDNEKALFWYLRAADHGYAPAQIAAACLHIDKDNGLTDYAEAYRLLTLAVHKEVTDENAESLSADFPHVIECFDEDERWMAVQEGYAEYLLGWLHGAGLVGAIDHAKAISWMEKAAKKGFRAAVFELAQKSEYGIERNEVWAKKALEYGEYAPLIGVARRYLDNDGTPQDSKKGLSILTELADKGIGSAQIALAEYLIKGKSIPKDADRALHYLLLAAKMVDAKLMTGLGIALYKSEKPEIDFAIKSLELAVAAGDDQALVELGNLYFDGAGEMTPDQEKAFTYFIQSAKKDVPRGWELAGYCLYEGKGALQNRREALGWYEKAAKYGLYNSYYMMGMIYGYDETLFNYEKAVSCFEKAANLGQSDALVRLGTMHLHGVGTNPPDRQKAFSYFNQASQADNSLGWEWAAYCHYWGYGTKKTCRKPSNFITRPLKRARAIASTCWVIFMDMMSHRLILKRRLAGLKKQRSRVTAMPSLNWAFTTNRGVVSGKTIKQHSIYLPRRRPKVMLPPCIISAMPLKTGLVWKRMKNRRLAGIASLRSWVTSGGCLVPADCFFAASAHRQIRKKADAG
ncbi:sel1 repeat family protein [Acetobacterium wieringae]|nr:tetratricopeptide repeat protein [Acetobacterium wieringae]URN84885.1 sel1 repeat family protein [Acetobacterium wieringae]